MTTPTASDHSSHRRGIALLIASTLAWSTAGLFTRMIHIDALSTLVWRGPSGGLAILAFIAWFEGRGAIASFARMGTIDWVYAGLSAGGMLTFIPALTYTTVAHVTIIYGSVPFVAAALGYLVLGEKPSRSAALASLIAFTGVGVMVSGHDAAATLFGDMLAFCMTCATAVMMIIGRRYPTIPFLPAASASGMLTALVALPLASQLPGNVGELGLIVASGIMNTALGLGLFVLGSALVPAVETALIGALEGPLSPLWVWLAFGETPSRATILGGALVTAAVLGHLWLSGRRRGET
jgi:drug/metabolite transporter (DMT)-like permease